MTGLSVLFSMNTSEACYVYGHMEAHRRANEHSIQQRYSDVLGPGRHRTPGTRYGLTSDLTSYTPAYSDTSSTLYKSNHGYTEPSRESYFSYPNLSSHTSSLHSSDGGSMSKYTRNYDITTRSYDSPRSHERGRLDLGNVDSSTFQPFEFGTCYTKSPRSHDSLHTAKSHDITTQNDDVTTQTHDFTTQSHDVTSAYYDRSTRNDDVTSQSPARSSSLSDRARSGHGGEGRAPLDPVAGGPLTGTHMTTPIHHRQRLNSGDSASSHASERSSHAEDKALFKALKHRYQESAERQSSDPSVKAPFSSWRRSGNYDDVSSSHQRRERNESRELSYSTDEERIREAAQPESNADELISNFRTALRRHVLSESEKEGESKPPSEGNSEESTAQKLERLRAARAMIHERRIQDKAKSESFATEYSPKLDRHRPASEKHSGKQPTMSVHKSHESTPSIDSDETITPKSTPKLARQKLVSDDAKQKFIETKRENKSTSRERDRSTESEKGSAARHRSARRDRQQAHTKHWSNESDDTAPRIVEASHKDVVPTAEEMLLGKSAKTATKTRVASKQTKAVDHSSPFGSVYSFKPSSSLSSKQESTDTTLDDHVKHVEDHKNVSRSEKETSKSSRRMKKYTKAKSLELGALSKEVEPAPVSQSETKDDITIGSDVLSMDESAQVLRKERIAKYKEERKKQLASISSKFDDKSGLPCLFLVSKSSNEGVDLLRSKSLKATSETKPSTQSSVSRSKSLKHEKVRDSDASDIFDAYSETSNLRGIQLAERGLQSQSHPGEEVDVYNKKDYSFNTDNIIDRLQALKKLKEEHLKKQGHTMEELRAKRTSKEDSDFDDLSSLDASANYTPRTLLADRAPFRDSDSSYISHSKERHIQSERDKKDLGGRHPQIEPLSETAESDVSDFEKPERKQSTQKRYKPKESESKPNFFEFGTVFTKKEVKPVQQTVVHVSDRESDSGRESVDSAARVRRRLPSLEDVLGTVGIDRNAIREITPEKTPEPESVTYNESTPEPEMQHHLLSRDDIAKLSADQIANRKTKSNVEKAKSRFKEDVSEHKPIELGTVFSGKKSEDKQKDVKYYRGQVDRRSVKKAADNDEDFTVDDFKAAEAKLNKQKKAEEFERAQKQKLREAKEAEKERLRKDTRETYERKHIDEHYSPPEEAIKVTSRPPSSPRMDRKKYESKFGQSSGLMEFGTVYSKKEIPAVQKTKEEQICDEATLKEKAEFQIEHSPGVAVAFAVHGSVEQAIVNEEKSKPKSGGKLPFEFSTSYPKKAPSVKEPTKIEKETEKHQKDIEAEAIFEKCQEPVYVTIDSKREVEKLQSEVVNAPSPKETTSDFYQKQNVEIHKRHFERKERPDSVSKSFMEFGTSYTKKEIAKPAAVGENVNRTQQFETQQVHKMAENIQEISQRFVPQTLPDDHQSEPETQMKEVTHHETYHSDVSDDSIAHKRKKEKFNLVRKLGSQFATPDSADRFEFGTSYSKKDVTSSPAAPKVASEGMQVSEEKVTSPAQSHVTGIKLTSQTSVEKKQDISKIDTSCKVEGNASVNERTLIIDIKALAVSTASGRQPEMPTSPTQQELPRQRAMSPRRGHSPTPPRDQSPQKVFKQQMVGVAIAQKVPDVKTVHEEPPKVVKAEATEVAMVATATDAKSRPSVVRQTSETKIELKQQAVMKSRPVEAYVPHVAEVVTMEKTVEKAALQDTKITEPQKVVKQVEQEKSAVVASHKPELFTEVALKHPEPKEVYEQERPPMVAVYRPELFTDVELKHAEPQKPVEKPEELPEFLKPDPQPIKKHHEPTKSADTPAKTSKAKCDLSKSKKEERSKKLEKLKHGKVKMEKTVLMKVRGEKQLMDSSLDDILNRNKEYLSDLEVPEFSHGKSGEKKSRPQSIHGQKSKRFRKKAALRRSKSEDRSHFQVQDSDEDSDEARSRIKNDLKKSAKTLETRGRRNARQSETANQSVESPQGQPTTALHPHDPARMPDNKVVMSAVSSMLQSGSQPSVCKADISLRQGIDHSIGNQRTESALMSLPLASAHDMSAKSAISTVTHQTVLSQRTTLPTGISSVISSSGICQPNTQLSGPSISQPVSQASQPTIQSSSQVTCHLISQPADQPIGQPTVHEPEIIRAGTDSDQSASSAMSEGSRKRRKDKTSLRKSKLNESSDDSVTQSHLNKDSSDESSRGRAGVRRAVSSRLARESREDKYKNGDDQQISTAINKLSEASEKTNGKEQTFASPRGIKRGTNFSQLLQKFSSSETSSSDTDSPRGRKPILLKRQEACRVSSASSDDATRRTPERTQSLKLSGKISTTSDKVSSDGASVQRSASFKSDFMKRRFSPEPQEGRRRLPETPKDPSKADMGKDEKVKTEPLSAVSKKSGSVSEEQSDKPSPELANVLNKRSDIVAKQQEVGAALERDSIHDGKVAKADIFNVASDEQVIADSEVLQMLRSRRKETDSSVESVAVSEAEKVTQKVDKTVERSDTDIRKVDVSKSSPVVSSSGPVTSSLSVATVSIGAPKDSKPRVLSQSSFESKTSLTLGHLSKDSSLSSVSRTSQNQSSSSNETTPSVPKLNLSSIDTILTVLESVTEDIGKPSISEAKLVKELSQLDIKSPTQVVQFIQTVEKEKSDTHKQETLPSQVSDISQKSEHFRKTSDSKENEVKIAEEVTKSTHVPSVEASIKQDLAQLPASSSTTVSNAAAVSSNSVTITTGTIDMTNKSEIMRRFSSRDKTTPERQSPQRAGPMKVMSQQQMPAVQPITMTTMTPSPHLQRTESMGRSESERPKGILKRTPSLKHSGVIVDPELAEVLRSRRHSNDEEEEEEGQKLTAEEEIRRAREEASAKVKEGSDDDSRQVSVAERIFQMHTKIEEVKSCPITPRGTYSGLTTPNSAALQQRSGTITPTLKQFSFEEGSQPSTTTALSGSQLIERLTSLEGQQSSVEEKRGRFQHRSRNDERTKTQPITLQEIQQADRQDRGLKPEQRNKTVPVTAAELCAVPAGASAIEMNTLKKKYDLIGARDSRSDSGILSGSDMEHQDTEYNDERVKMSVSAKASMFLQIQESLKEQTAKKSASGAKRYIDRKKRERSRTLPITEDEVKMAAEFADEDNHEAQWEKEEPMIPQELGEGDKVDELTSISLADKVKLFTSIEEEKKAAAQKKGPAPPPKRRGRKLASRFSTQPVTYEEVEKAAKISPLACSLVKPPDPELLSGLSVKAQQELIIQHAQQSLSQPGSRSGSKVSSRATSVTDLREGSLTTDFQTIINTGLNEKLAAVVQTEDSGIKPSQVRSKGFGILKQEEQRTSSSVEKFTTTELDSKKKSILKSELESKLSIGLFRPSAGGAPTVSEINRVLKKGASMDSSTIEFEESSDYSETSSMSEVKGILKKDSSFETRRMESVISQLSSRVSRMEPDSSEGSEEAGESDNKGVDSSGDNLDSDEGLLDVGADGERSEETTTTTMVKKRSSKSKRRFNRDRQLETERYKTQPADGAESVELRQKKKYGSRHFTQPITPEEKKEAESTVELPEATKTGSISDRLNALKKSGDEDWRKRVSKPVDLDNLDRRSMSPPFTPPTVKMRDKKELDTPRPSSIADRLNALGSAQAGWKDRVGETDVKKFTLEHKLSASGHAVGESPLVARLRNRGPRREGSRDSESSDTSEIGSPSSPSKDTKKFSMPKEVICADIPVELLREEKTQSPLVEAEEEERKPTNVEVPKIGEELDLFFRPSESRMEVEHEKLEVTVDDFNEIFLNANDMLETTKKIKPKRRHNPKSRNPLKTMSANLEVRSEYTEVITGVADRELKRVKTAEISSKSGYAVEALAGLASVENFSKVELRKTESDGNGTAMNRALEPFMPVMLIHVKGRRKVQCRLVEPSAASINSGDCYVLVTNDKLIQWIGDYCNVIEKAKAADFCDFVRQKRDLGCKRAHDITTVEEKKGLLGGGRHFWNQIGGHKPYMACGPAEEDELYEQHITETNRIYQLEENKLVPVEEYWGAVPKYEMLQPDKVFVFDFGSEVYLWQGKTVTPNQRKVSLKLAQQLWNNGYNYSACDINPLSPFKSEEEGGLSSKSDTRPDWALFGKVNQNMETILFREKFADWPDTSRLIKVKGTEEVGSSKMDLADLKAYDADLMVPVNTSPVTLVLEGSNVGRGTKWEQDMDGFIQIQQIETLKVRIWHVLEYDHFEIEPHSYGQFHEGDTYVIRWQYMIINASMKSLKGQASRHSHMGRERCAYFFWQGKGSTINEKGASALMTVELDEERGPQVRVIEGKEPACFLNLFEGRMIIHIGKREEEATNTQGPWRFYCLRNEYENELCLIEVERDVSSLRSVSSHLLLNVETGKLLVWQGCKSPEHVKKLAMRAANNLEEKCPLEVGLHRGARIKVMEMEEGSEPLEFWRAMNGRCGDRSPYNCLLGNPESFSHTLRLFHMTSVSGVFEAHEVMNPSRSPDLPTRFPCIQTDLYKASQPALFLIDNGHEVYLWQGWWPEGDEEQENVLTGSAQTRFTTDRKCALETTLQYCQKIRPDSPPPAYLVYAGLEPLSFTNLFPFWTVDERVKELNLKEGKSDGQLERVEELLRKLKKTRYPLAELLDTPLPEGVDPLRLETYLCDEEFESVLDMTREEYYAMPTWKQSQLKKQVGLY